MRRFAVNALLVVGLLLAGASAAMPNVLAVDCAATGDVVGAAAVLNGLAPTDEAAPVAAGAAR